MTFLYDVPCLTNHWSAAGSNTVYLHDPLGNLTNIAYPTSGTVVFQYDTLNRLTNLVSALGSIAFGWTSGDQLASESGPWAADTVNYTYANRLLIGLSLSQPNASPWTQSYAYDGFQRLTNVASPAGIFGYQYNDITAGWTVASDVISELDYPNGARSSRAYDSLSRLTNSTLVAPDGSTILDLHGYVYNQGSQRTKQVFTAGNYVNYAYDGVGQLVTALGKEAGGASRLNEQFGYAYDAAFNLNYRTNNALLETFGVNSLNELASLSRSGTLTVAGTVSTAAPPASVTVNSFVAILYQDGTFARTNVSLNDGLNIITATAQDGYGRKGVS